MTTESTNAPEAQRRDGSALERGVMQHTPGPWIWGENYRGLYGAGPDNEVLAFAPYEGMWLGYGPAKEANARLIEAAPKLLSALLTAEALLYAHGKPIDPAITAALVAAGARAA